MFEIYEKLWNKIEDKTLEKAFSKEPVFRFIKYEFHKKKRRKKGNSRNTKTKFKKLKNKR